MNLAQLATDPLYFFATAFAALRATMADFQRKRFAAIAPALVATAKGGIPADPSTVLKLFIETIKGTSKTSDLALVVLWLLAFSRRPLLIQIAAADFDQAAELKKAMATWLRLMPWLSARVKIHNWRAYCEATGVEAEILPADENSSHGSRPDVLIIDELVHITKWPFVETLADNASKVPNCLTIIATNAGFLNTPAWQWRELARTSPRWRFLQHNRPAPWIDPEEIREAEARNSPQRFARLWKGVWSTGTGDYIDSDDIEGCITADGPVTGEMDLRDYRCVAGLDIGVRNDHSALVTLGVKAGVPRIRLMNAQWWTPGVRREVDLLAVEKGCRVDAQRYHWQALWYDPSQAQLMVQRLRRTAGVMCCEMPFVSSNLDRMARTLMEVFNNRSIELYDCPRLVADLQRIVIEEKPFGHKITAISDASGHADLGVALSIALPAAVELLHNFGGGSGGGAEAFHLPHNGGRHGVHIQHGPAAVTGRANRGGSGRLHHAVPFVNPAKDNGWRRI